MVGLALYREVVSPDTTVSNQVQVETTDSTTMSTMPETLQETTSPPGDAEPSGPETTKEETSSEETTNEETNSENETETADTGDSGADSGEVPYIQRYIRECTRGTQDRKECVQEYVSEAAPEAEYVGGRIDLDSGGGSQDEVFYFEDPTLDSCVFSKQEYKGERGKSSVIIVFGRGSLSEGEECIPEP